LHVFLRDEFDEDINISTRVKRKYSDKYSRIMRGYSDLLADRIKELDQNFTPNEVLNRIEPIFKHSPDYRSVSLRGQPFSLTPIEAQVIKILHEVRENDTPDISLTYLIQEICGSESNYGKLKDIFRNNDARKTLIKQSGKGLYRLNV